MEITDNCMFGGIGSTEKKCRTMLLECLVYGAWFYIRISFIGNRGVYH